MCNVAIVVGLGMLMLQMSAIRVGRNVTESTKGIYFPSDLPHNSFCFFLLICAIRGKKKYVTMTQNDSELCHIYIRCTLNVLKKKLQVGF